MSAALPACLVLASLCTSPASARELLLFDLAPPEAGDSLGSIDAFEDEDWTLDLPDPADRDPIEGFNRGVFRFNEGFMRWVLDPLAVGYAFVIPDPARRGVHNFFTNLNAPVVLVNDVLQLSLKNAGVTGFRFLFNTTFGMLGLLDAGKIVGVPGHHSDFGQTLAIYDVGSGPYIVVPLIGPTTLRDGLGEAVDFLMRIDTWTLALGPGLVLYGGDQFSVYDIERERLDALRQTSVDFYAALRGAYLLDRQAGIERRRQQLGRCPSPASSAEFQLGRAEP